MPDLPGLLLRVHEASATTRLLGDELHLFRLALRFARRLGDARDAEDVAQVVVISLIYRRHAVTPGKEVAWLWRAIVLEVRSRRRAASRQIAVLTRWYEFRELETQAEPDRHEEVLERLHAAIEKLPDPEREVIHRKLRGASLKCIGSQMNLPFNTVKDLVKRAYEQLRNDLKDAGESHA